MRHVRRPMLPLDVPTRGDLPLALMEVRRAYGNMPVPFQVAHDDGCPALKSQLDADCTCELVAVREESR